MTLVRPTTAVLALAAGHATGLVQPRVFPLTHHAAAVAASFTCSSRSPSASISPTTTAGAVATGRNSGSSNTARMVMLLRPDHCRRSSECIRRAALMLQHGRPAAAASAAAAHPAFFSGAVGCMMDPTKHAVQSISVRQASTSATKTPTMAAAARKPQVQQQGVGRPAEVYPPPEHMHGVFAVYKPKGLSSNAVVQIIKVRQQREGLLVVVGTKEG